MYYHREMFGTDYYSTVRKVDKLIPVSIRQIAHLNQTEAIIDAITKLRERKDSSMDIRGPNSNKERIKYLTINHRDHHIGSSIHTRNYGQKLLHQSYEPHFESTFEIPSATFGSTSTLQL